MRFIDMGVSLGKGTEPRIYAIGGPILRQGKTLIGLDPYYKVTGISNHNPVLQELNKGSDEYNYIRKWVANTPVYIYETEYVQRVKKPAQRQVLGQKRAKCHVSKEEVIKMLSE